MSFTDFGFLLFFPVVIGIYFLLPHRHRWWWLLAASYYFYGCWKWEYLILIALTTVVDWFIALKMDGKATKEERKPLLWASLAMNFGLLFAFKYLNFFNDSVRATLNQFNIFYDVPAFQILLPVGISFYTFQEVAYMIDVYRGNQKAERKLGMFALFITFWPQLVAGPIERSGKLLTQLHKKFEFDYERARSGMKLILWGLFKKIVIADLGAGYVNLVYGAPGQHEGWPVVVATYLFMWQILCDFSAYSDICIGSARVMGFNLMENFRRPFLAKSLGEFWRRWHISLMTWFRDYLYAPLGGGKGSEWRKQFNVFMIFLASGIWHGAAWTFILFGVCHGVIMVLSNLTRDTRNKLWKGAEQLLAPRVAPRYAAAGWTGSIDVQAIRDVLGVLITFHINFVILVFFRAQSLGDAMTVYGNMFNFSGSTPILLPGFGYAQFAIALAAIGVVETIHVLQEKEVWKGWLGSRPVWVRWSAYYAIIFAILLFGTFGHEQFIYFQF